MEVKQIYGLVNDITKEVLGEEALVKEDLSNIVDIGDSILNKIGYDNYVKKLVNRIGKTIFVARKYSGRAPRVLMDAWEFGSVCQKIHAELPEATVNESWDLTDGASYDQDTFHAPAVEVKFFNSKVTFEVDISITEVQVKESFLSVAQLNSFLSMIFNKVDQKITIALDNLIMRTINNMIGETIYDLTSGGGTVGVGGVRAVNLLYLYNQTFGVSPALTAAKAWYNKDFLRFAGQVLREHIDKLNVASKLFNVGGTDKFTPRDLLHIVLHSKFASGIETYLYGDTYHEEYVKIPKAETVPYWQGTGTGYAVADTSKIYLKTASGHDVTLGGIMGVMFDRDALGVCNKNSRVRTHDNGKAEFINYFYKEDGHYFNDLNEQFVVFYVADNA